METKNIQTHLETNLGPKETLETEKQDEREKLVLQKLKNLENAISKFLSHG